MVLRHGAENFMFMVLDIIAKVTPSKKDDKLVADLKAVMGKGKKSKSK